MSETDIWSLGVVVYEMLAQRLPFTGATSMDTIVAILHRDPAPLSEVAGEQYTVSFLLEQTVNSCLRKEMTDRLGSASELLGELKRVREQLNNQPHLTVSAIKLGRHEAHASSRLASAFFAASIFPGRCSSSSSCLVAAIAGSIIYRRSEAAELASSWVISRSHDRDKRQALFADERGGTIGFCRSTGTADLNDDGRPSGKA